MFYKQKSLPGFLDKAWRMYCSSRLFYDSWGETDDFLNGLQKPTKMQIGLTIGKDGLTSGNSLIICSYFS